MVEVSSPAIRSVLPTVFAARVFDRDVVGEALRVVEVDRHLAGLGRRFGGRVGEFAVRVGFEFDGRAAAFAAAGFLAAFGRAPPVASPPLVVEVVVVESLAAAGDERGGGEGENE